ncbi:hypothetical protein BDV19DRAFT_203245 [Aspergillus venezuelensis]
MTHGTCSHHRRSPSGPKSPKARTTRPSFHRKGTSSGNLSISKLGSGQLRSVAVDDDELLSEMASSFLNFCAMCETQITVPDSRLLYCSESCRRKDSLKPLPASKQHPTTIAPSYSPPQSPPMSPPSYIVAPMTPRKAPFTGAGSRIPADSPEADTDMDPTEWKPVIASETRSASIMSSDAWHYLSKFHSDESVPILRRMRDHGHSQSSTSISTLPSLSQSSSSSTASSSVSSSPPDYASHMYEASNGPPPPRHRHCFSGSSSAKGVELVIPQITVISDTPVEQPNGGSIFPADSGLGDKKTETTPIITVTEGTVTN